MDYRSAGVDIDKGDRVVQRIKDLMGQAGARIGHFGGAVPFPVGRWKEPLVVTSIDGVGTKVMVAAAVGRHEVSGRDMVHHSINDIACCGAEPIAFMDYIAMGSLDEDVAVGAIEGVVKACQYWDVPLVGGETAEMPGVYKPGEYDLVGAVVGVVERSEFIDGRGVAAGDVLLGFPSTGLHTNGFSLARRVLADAGVKYDAVLPELGRSVGETLLDEHRCYLGEIRELKRRCRVKGLAHITGGGLPGNVARVIPEGLQAEFAWGSWQEPPIFALLRRLGDIPEPEMQRTFNLGVGMVAVLDPVTAEAIMSDFPDELESPFRMGVVKGG